MSQAGDPDKRHGTRTTYNNNNVSKKGYDVRKKKSHAQPAPAVTNHPIRILQKHKLDIPVVNNNPTHIDSSNQPTNKRNVATITSASSLSNGTSSVHRTKISSNALLEKEGDEIISSSNKVVEKKHNNNGQQQQTNRKRTPKSSLTLGDLIPQQHDIWSKPTTKNQSSQQYHQSNVNESQNGGSLPSLSASNFPALNPTTKESRNGNQRNFTKQPTNTKQESTVKSSKNNNTVKNNLNQKNASNKGKVPGAKDGDTSRGGNNQQSSSTLLSTELHNNNLKKIDNLFTPKARESGSEDQLLRMYQEGKFTVQNKGRQRIRPRRKKFSTLKKKVLDERLQQWKNSQIFNESTLPNPDEKVTDYPTKTVVINGFCTQEELEDDDEYAEIVENLKDMAKRVGEVKRVFVCRSKGSDDETEQQQAVVPVFVEFLSSDDTNTAANCWDGLRLGGQQLESQVIRHHSNINDSTSAMFDETMNDTEWYAWCLTQVKEKFDTNNQQVDSAISEIVLNQILTDDDLSDPDCLEESMNDIREMASAFGDIATCRIDGKSVIIQYSGEASVAQKAVVALNSMVLGGNKVLATLPNSTTRGTTTEIAANEMIFVVELHNLLTEDDLADEDCLQESLEDIRELAVQYGTVQDISTGKKESEGNEFETIVLVTYSSSDDATRSVAGFNGMMIGGQRVTATFPQNQNTMGTSRTVDPAVESETDKPVDVMYSGNKIISDRFAECKRVPKVANAGIPRKYATLVHDESVKPLLNEMLSELSRLQQRAINDKNAKARRRLVMGLREVARGIRSHKVKLVVMANNLDEYGIIDDKLQEILDLAHEEDIPVFFEFNKRNLGKALGKSIKIAVVGIQNTDGADQQYKKLVKLIRTAPIIPAAPP